MLSISSSGDSSSIFSTFLVSTGYSPNLYSSFFVIFFSCSDDIFVVSSFLTFYPRINAVSSSSSLNSVSTVTANLLASVCYTRSFIYETVLIKSGIPESTKIISLKYLYLVFSNLIKRYFSLGCLEKTVQIKSETWLSTLIGKYFSIKFSIVNSWFFSTHIIV